MDRDAIQINFNCIATAAFFRPSNDSFWHQLRTFCSRDLSVVSTSVDIDYLGRYKKSLIDWLTDWFDWMIDNDYNDSSIAMYYCSAIRLILIYRPSEGGRLSRPRHCSQCAARAQSCVSQWFSWKHKQNKREGRGYNRGKGRWGDGKEGKGGTCSRGPTSKGRGWEGKARRGKGERKGREEARERSLPDLKKIVPAPLSRQNITLRYIVVTNRLCNCFCNNYLR